MTGPDDKPLNPSQTPPTSQFEKKAAQPLSPEALKRRIEQLSAERDAWEKAVDRTAGKSHRQPKPPRGAANGDTGKQEALREVSKQLEKIKRELSHSEPQTAPRHSEKDKSKARD